MSYQHWWNDIVLLIQPYVATNGIATRIAGLIMATSMAVSTRLPMRKYEKEDYSNLFSRLSSRGVLVASTSSAIRTSSGILLISIGVGCGTVKALWKIIACLQPAFLAGFLPGNRGECLPWFQLVVNH